MRRLSASDLALKALGPLRPTATALKDCQLLSEPVANSSIASYRPLLILPVEFELARGLWRLRASRGGGTISL